MTAMLFACSKEDDIIQPTPQVDYLISNEWILTEINDNNTSLYPIDSIHNFMGNGTVIIDSRTANYLRSGNTITISELNLDEITIYNLRNLAPDNMTMESEGLNYIFVKR